LSANVLLNESIPILHFLKYHASAGGVFAIVPYFLWKGGESFSLHQQR